MVFFFFLKRTFVIVIFKEKEIVFKDPNEL